MVEHWCGAHIHKYLCLKFEHLIQLVKSILFQIRRRGAPKYTRAT
jgi:hypothetical protein